MSFLWVCRKVQLCCFSRISNCCTWPGFKKRELLFLQCLHSPTVNNNPLFILCLTHQFLYSHLLKTCRQIVITTGVATALRRSDDWLFVSVKTFLSTEAKQKKGNVAVLQFSFMWTKAHLTRVCVLLSATPCQQCVSPFSSFPVIL